VKKWIDYSSKYGIGYALNNGSCGVYFNDSSKMVAFCEEYFYYIERVDKEDVQQKYYFSDYPPELKKKVSLFGHFRGYLYREQENSVRGGGQEKELVYIRRWYRVKHANIFRLSNKSVQAIFIDQSELLISSARKRVVYISKHKEKYECSLNEAVQCGHRELIKRYGDRLK
jgi:polo-like kinase 1